MNANAELKSELHSDYQKIERMTPAMRIVHWVTVFSVLAAIVTGFYIGHPYYQTYIADPAVDKYVMAWNRWVHFISAILLDVTAIIVGYFYFFSRFEQPWKKLTPSAKNVKEFGAVVVNLITLNRVKKFDSSHADSFNAVYFTVLHLLLVFMLFSGLQLYVHGLASGESSIGSWWPWMLHLVTDWTLWVFDGNMGVRIAHHTTMWWIIVWVIFHIYYQVWRTIFWREGDIAIAFGGSKFARKKKKESE